MSKARPLKAQPKHAGAVANFWGRSSRNLVKNLLSRDMGLLSSAEFISGFNRSRLDNIKLSRTRSINPLANSVTWFSLDNIDSQ